MSTDIRGHESLHHHHQQPSQRCGQPSQRCGTAQSALARVTSQCTTTTTTTPPSGDETAADSCRTQHAILSGRKENSPFPSQKQTYDLQIGTLPPTAEDRQHSVMTVPDPRYSKPVWIVQRSGKVKSPESSPGNSIHSQSIPSRSQAITSGFAGVGKALQLILRPADVIFCR